MESFEETRDLPPAELQRRLTEGSPPERLWCAWRLALQSGAAAGHRLAEAVAEDDSPGVREGLVPVLGGLGEREAIRVLLEADPDKHVRSAAGRILTRIASPRDTGAALLLETCLEHDRSPAVRAEVLGSMTSGGWSVPDSTIQRCLIDPSLAVRRAAVEFLLARRPLERLYPGALEGSMAHEPDPALRLELIERSVLAGRPSAAVASAGALDDDRLIAALDLLRRRGHRFPWADLARLSDRTAAGIADRLFELLAAEGREPALGWVLDRLLVESWWQAGWRVLEEVAPGRDPAAWSDGEVAKLRKLAEGLMWIEEDVLESEDPAESAYIFSKLDLVGRLLATIDRTGA